MCCGLYVVENIKRHLSKMQNFVNIRWRRLIDGNQSNGGDSKWLVSLMDLTPPCFVLFWLRAIMPRCVVTGYR